ncbi:uncharacterized protein LOC135488294 [Lineus longissimus]|uniref:uncharacterized protein LOC135488294 n=1 Tax=Lineus longissimus TaxID=88925 RepID=UPI002B4D208C
MSQWFWSHGLYLHLAVLLVRVVVSFPGWGQPQEGCGRCLIESHPEEQCDITGFTDIASPLPRSHCYITAPKLKVKVVPVKGCRRLTFNVTIRLPAEGTDCLTGYRLSIAHHESQDFLFAYDIKLSNGNWSRFGKQMVLEFQIPDRRKTTCAPTVVEGNEYFFKLQPVPGKSPMMRSFTEDVFDYVTVDYPEWEPGKWASAVNHEVLADGVRAWFKIPPEPQCFCLRRFKLMLVFRETELEVGAVIVIYPHNEGFFPKIEEGTYQICVRALEKNDECQGPCGRSCTDWFTFPKAPTTPLITTTSNGSRVVIRTIPNKTGAFPSWFGPTVGVTAIVAFLLLFGGVAAYQRVKKSPPAPDTDSKPDVAVLYHGSSNRNALQCLKSLLERDNRFVSRLINLSDLRNKFRTTCFRKCPDDVINMSAIILIVCSKHTADDFLETQSWPRDAVHQGLLSLIRVRSNQRKRVLVKLNPEWPSASNLLDWMKFTGGTKALTCDTVGREFLNAIIDVAAESNYEWPSMSTLPPEIEEGFPPSGSELHQLDPNVEMMRGMSAQADPLLPALNMEMQA